MAAVETRSVKVRLGIKAQAVAVQQLKEKHAEEFLQLHGDARESMGLERETGRTASQDPAERIRRRMERLQAQLDEIENGKNGDTPEA